MSRSCTLFHCRSGWWVWPVCSSHVHCTTALSSSDVGVCALYSSSLGVVPAPPYQRSKRPYTFGDQSGPSGVCAWVPNRSLSACVHASLSPSSQVRMTCSCVYSGTPMRARLQVSGQHSEERYASRRTLASRRGQPAMMWSPAATHMLCSVVAARSSSRISSRPKS